MKNNGDSLRQELAQRVGNFCRDKALLECDAVIAGCSGGPDSVALLLILSDILKESDKPVKLFAIHINHNLRPGDCDRDQKLTEEFCSSLNIPLKTVGFDVEKYAEENRLELRNSPFKLISPEEELINSRLRKPCGNEAAKLMSATMIATFLTGSVRGGLDVQKIGVIMHKLQYKFKIRHGYCYYRVVEIPYDQQQNYLALDDDYENNDNNENIQSNEELELPF